MKTNVSNRDIAHLLRSVAAAYIIKNKNRFRIIAYENAADAVEHLTREIKDVWRDGRLDDIPGIGPNIAQHLEEYFKKGHSAHFEKAFKGIPESVFELMRIPSLGPKRAYALAKALDLKTRETTIQNLKNAIHAGKIERMPRFGKRSQESILKALELYEQEGRHVRRMPLPYAFTLADALMDYLRKNPAVKRVDALGSLRRMIATIGDIDISAVVDSSKYKDVIDYFLKYPKKLKTENAGEKKASIVITGGVRADLRLQDEEGYGSMLQYFTGSKDHNIRLREYALRKNLSLSEYGIKNTKTGKVYKFDTEEKFYKYIGLDYIPPEIREATNEIDLAVKGKIPRLIEVGDIKGDLHTHSNYDLKPSHDFGKNSFSEMAQKASELKYEYIGFSEHNPKTSGLSKEQIVKIMKKRKEDIEREMSGSKIGFHYLIGLETDILPSGELALPQEAVEFIDYQIVSVHSSFNMEANEMTKRVLKALSFPKVKILGHPTGRLLGKRDGYELEWDKVFEECKRRNIALEINSWPQRLDLPDTLVGRGVKKGVRFIINTDSHAAYQMENMKYGVAVTRRGWLTLDNVCNTMSYKDFRKWISE